MYFLTFSILRRNILQQSIDSHWTEHLNHEHTLQEKTKSWLPLSTALLSCGIAKPSTRIRPNQQE